MNLKLLNSTLDVIAQKGVLAMLEATGFYYLFISAHSDPFIVDKALIGLVLVLTGALFEYLITMAKVGYLKQMSQKRSRNIDEQQKLLEKEHQAVLDALEALKGGKKALIER